MPARNGDWKRFGIGGGDAVPAQGVQEGAEVARRVETPGAEVGSTPPVPEIRRSISKSQYTSRVWPWASSSAQAKRTRGNAGEPPDSTASTSHRRERTSTSSPICGGRSGSVVVEPFKSRFPRRAECTLAQLAIHVYGPRREYPTSESSRARSGDFPGPGSWECGGLQVPPPMKMDSNERIECGRSILRSHRSWLQSM